VPKRSKGQSPNTPDSMPAGGHESTFQRVRNAVWTPLAVAGISIGGLLVGALAVTFAQARRWERRIHQVLPPPLGTQNPPGIAGKCECARPTLATHRADCRREFPFGRSGWIQPGIRRQCPGQHGRLERRRCRRATSVPRKTQEEALGPQPDPRAGADQWPRAQGQAAAAHVTLPTTIELGDTARLHLFAEGSSTADEPLLEESNE